MTPAQKRQMKQIEQHSAEIEFRRKYNIPRTRKLTAEMVKEYEGLTAQEIKTKYGLK